MRVLSVRAVMKFYYRITFAGIRHRSDVHDRFTSDRLPLVGVRVRSYNEHTWNQFSSLPNFCGFRTHSVNNEHQQQGPITLTTKWLYLAPFSHNTRVTYEVLPIPSYFSKKFAAIYDLANRNKVLVLRGPERGGERVISHAPNCYELCLHCKSMRKRWRI